MILSRFYKRFQDAGARMTGRLYWLLFGHIEQDQEYVERFLMPHYERMVEAGISSQRAHEICRQAIDKASYPYPLPGMLLRDMADAEIAKVKERDNG